MKLITLSIDKRASHVINFEHSAEQERLVDTYVITKSDDTELLSFYDSSGQPQDIGGDRDDEQPLFRRRRPSAETPADQPSSVGIVLQTSRCQQTAYIASIDCCVDDADELSLSILLTTTPVAMAPVSPRLSFSRQQERGQWILTLRNTPDTPTMIHVTLSLDDGTGDVVAKQLLLCVAPSHDIADVVLDFGSEASQMAIFDESPMNIDGIQTIFDDMKELLPVSPAAPGEHYVQQDAHDDNLFKSVFYAKSMVDDAESPVPQLDAATQKAADISALRMITTESEAQSLQQDGAYLQMPNVKISGFGGVREPRVGGKPISKFRDGFFYRATINRFVLSAFTKVDTEGRAKCVRLNILMPNVYTHNDVQSRLKWLKSDISAMLATDVSVAAHVRCAEVIVVSESDASLLGALDLLTHPDNPRPLEQGKYLIMDAGKGTIDFSIVEYRAGEIDSRFRSGIIGAGNAMSYAYLLGLLNDYLADSPGAPQVKDEDLQHWIFTNILQPDADTPADTALLRQLMENVDRYKIAMSTSQPDHTIRPVPAAVSRQSSQASSSPLSSFIAYVDQMVVKGRYKPLSPNGRHYVNAMVGRIASDVARSLSIAKAEEFHDIKRVFFAGRAFCDKQLKNAIFDQLRRNNIVQQELEYLDEDHYAFNQKNICLYIRSHLQRGVTSNRMLSTPFARVRKDSGEPAANLAGDRHNGLFAFIGRWWRRLTRKAPKLVNTLNETFNGYDIPNDAMLYDYVAAVAPLNGMVYGYDLEINDMQLDWILIGGTYYHPSSSGKLKLFYSDDRIFVRTVTGGEETTRELLPDDTANMKFSSLTFATLFPYVNAHAGEMNNVYIPRYAASPGFPVGQYPLSANGIQVTNGTQEPATPPIGIRLGP